MDHRDTVNQQQLALATAFREAVAALAAHDWALAKTLECRGGVQPALERIDEYDAKKYRPAKLREKAALKKVEGKASARRASRRRLKIADRPAHVPVIIRRAIRLPAEE
ncbi:hypothetical protein [Lichenicoccus roseus]|uniref:Uncharacterized protein n=1 Tax=Lichenicoccus roseus TaxID=2683649 RepID=A0A5R9J6C3_9PROT|nr:hypothetical protein [Lichenicoccus roseus]TLU71161.1 hypothetical protein FE263_18500 [Lichenicoccus roseus]